MVATVDANSDGERTAFTEQFGVAGSA